MQTLTRVLLTFLLAASGLLLGGLGLAAPAGATFAGADGRIAFVRANQIYTVAAAGGAVTQLTTTGKNYRPEWSPDGNRVAFVNETASGQRDVWVMNANGSGKSRVTTVGDVSQGVTWGPNGFRLAFIGSGNRLMYVRATTPYGAPRPFLGYNTGDPWSEDEDPSVRHEIYGTSRDWATGTLAWSSDNRISFLGAYDAQLDWSFQIFNVATAENHESFASGGDCCGYTRWTEFVWGPQSQMGYSQALDEEYGSIYHPTAVIYPGVPYRENGDTGAAPSPSGTRIAVTNAGRIFVSNLNGSGRRLLTQGYQPDWQRR